jgi:1-phosphofructokinase
MSTIVTFTANPSVDRTSEVPHLERGAVLRASAIHIDAGGKGVNVTRALAANGHHSIAVLPSGGPEGAHLERLLRSEALEFRAVPVTGALRSNITIVEPDGTTTKINEPGPELSAAELSALRETLFALAEAGTWVVLSGSLPPAAPEDLYAELTVALHARGARVAVDTSGPVLRATLAAGPDVIKPNRRELAESSGAAVANRADALRAVERLRAAGARTILASLGADGAILADGRVAHHAFAPVSTQRSTVGAGDAMLAGFLAAGGAGPEALAEAVAWGSAAVTLPGSRMPAPDDLDREAVQIHSLNPLEVGA